MLISTTENEFQWNTIVIQEKESESVVCKTEDVSTSMIIY